MKTVAWLSTFALAAGLPGAAMAYIGPGAGLTAIGSVLAFLGVILLLVAGFVWYPVKRLLRRRRRGASVDADTGSDAPDA